MYIKIWTFDIPPLMTTWNLTCGFQGLVFVLNFKYAFPLLPFFRVFTLSHFLLTCPYQRNCMCRIHTITWLHLSTKEPNKPSNTKILSQNNWISFQFILFLFYLLYLHWPLKSIKRSLALMEGLTLVEIPCWWDGSVDR